MVGSFDPNIVSDSYLESQVKSQLAEWWGETVVQNWKLLKIYRIP